MRTIFKIAALVVATTFALSASAQQVVKQRVGVYKESGNVVVAEATTSLVVDLVVERETFKPGPYARYAQKLLGTRASLVAKDEYRLVEADVAVLKDAAYYATDECPEHHTPVYIDYSPLAVDRLSSTELGVESAAAEAAERVFALRHARLELVTGELGEGVFGGGLESALREIDNLERKYLELFYGRSEVTISSKRIVLAVDNAQTSNIVARFSPVEGLVSKDDLSGDIVMVVIKPSNMEYPQSDIKGTVAYRYANNCTVMVTYGQQQLVSRILPIYEFGATVMYLNPQK